MDLFRSSCLRLVFCSILLNACFGNQIYKYDMNFNESGSNIFNSTKDSALDYEKQSTDDCSNYNSSQCFAKKLTMLLNKVEHSSTVQLLPGVHLMWPSQHKTLLGRNNKTDQINFGKLNDYLSSVSLRIQLFHPKALTLLKSLQEKISSVVQSEGRKKMKDGAGIIGLGVMAGGSIMLFTLVTLAVMAGKALMTSVIALVLAAISGLSMLKGDDKPTTYEVVSRPVVSHGHSHSSEIQYEHAGHHGYKRSTDFPNSQFADNLQMAYNKWN